MSYKKERLRGLKDMQENLSYIKKRYDCALDKFIEKVKNDNNLIAAVSYGSVVDGELLLSLNELVDLGNTVLVIEHNLDLIKTADYIIDMGPDAGENGGKIVIEGTPENIIMCDESYTGKYLLKYLE